MEAIDTINPIHRISVEQFHRMIEAGVFAEGDRLELINGEMRDMTPIGPPHNGCTGHLNMTFAPQLTGKAIVRVQGALVLDEGTELYPDLAALTHMAIRHPRKMKMRHRRTTLRPSPRPSPPGGEGDQERLRRVFSR